MDQELDLTSPLIDPGIDPDDAAVTRTIDLEVDVDELWELVSDADELATWLGDAVELDVRPGARGTIVDDGIVRRVMVDEVVETERVSWRWWDDDGSASRVELEVVSTPMGSRLVVTETRLAHATLTTAPHTAEVRDSSRRRATRWELRAALLHLVSAPVHAVA